MITIFGNDYFGPQGFALARYYFPEEDSSTGEYFMSLPEATQQALIRESTRSHEDLHDCVERYRLKE